jgi:prepilin-type N-terminal cleavage/methylation domain-containing protein
VKIALSISKTGPARRGVPARLGFTLVEMMVTVALLGFIVVGLTTMFVQAQRAFRAGMNQTDVLESGRAMTDMLTHQLEEAAPAGYGGLTNFDVQFETWSTNGLVAGSPARTNVIDSFYFLTHSNLTTTLNGYVVALTNAVLTNAGFGTLYCFQTNFPSSSTNLLLSASMFFQGLAGYAVSNIVTSGNNNNIDSNLVRVADGIIHFRLLPYNPAGNLITPPVSTNAGIFIYTYTNLEGTIYAATTNLPTLPFGENLVCTFTSNAIPAYVDLELGVLESSTLATIAALPPGPVQQQYLANSMTAGRIHLFRRHVVLTTVDPQAYP